MQPPHQQQQQLTDLPDWQVGPRSQVLIGGRFQVLDEIGMGSTAIVYKARDTQNQSIVALKVLKGSAAIHPRLSAGFKREAEIGQTIQHPNTIRIYDCGVHGPWIYLVMEYVTGRTLAEILSLSHRMPLSEFETLCRQLLDGLDCVHANGIVHRDLKPANLMMTQSGVWKLMDFGIARRVAANATAGPSLGTPDYMSPEQLVGEAATPVSDLFATGIVFYEALTGAVPFRDWKLIDRCTKPAPRVRDLRPGVPAWLDELVARSLAIKPEHRFASALEMLAALGSFEESVTLRTAIPVLQNPATPAPVQLALASPPPLVVPSPALADSKPLSDSMTDAPGRPDLVFGRFLDILHLLYRRSSQGHRHEPLTPWTIRVLPNGQPELWAHNPGTSQDTLTVESPKYASPEMLRGSGLSDEEQVQSDLYAIGFILYEQLLGRRLFRGEFGRLDDERSGLGWMEWHSDSSKALRPAHVLLPAIPAAASEMIASMTSKDPAKRSSSYVDCIRVLQNVLHRVQPTKQIQLPPRAAVGADAQSGILVPQRRSGRKKAFVALAIAAAAIAVTALAALAASRFLEIR